MLLIQIEKVISKKVALLAIGNSYLCSFGGLLTFMHGRDKFARQHDRLLRFIQEAAHVAKVLDTWPSNGGRAASAKHDIHLARVFLTAMLQDMGDPSRKPRKD